MLKGGSHTIPCLHFRPSMQCPIHSTCAKIPKCGGQGRATCSKCPPPWHAIPPTKCHQAPTLLGPHWRSKCPRALQAPRPHHGGGGLSHGTKQWPNSPHTKAKSMHFAKVTPTKVHPPLSPQPLHSRQTLGMPWGHVGIFTTLFGLKSRGGRPFSLHQVM